MIVWIDGTFGVGKSSVAENLQVLLNKPDVVVLDSDPFYLSGLNILRYSAVGYFLKIMHGFSPISRPLSKRK